MSAEQYNTTVRSSHDKSEWERSLVGHHQQQSYILQQGTPLQTQHVYSHHHHHHPTGGSLEDATLPRTAAESAFGNMNPSIDGCIMQSTHHHANAGQGANMPSHRSNQLFGILPPLHTSNNNNHRSSVNIASRPPRQPRGGEEHMYSGKAGAALSMSTPTKSSAPRRVRNSSLSPLTVRPTGTKDRHSKVRTAKGLRDRRVRLSAPTAIQFFDVQDRLGYDQPSKAVDWLIKKARAAIDELAPVEGVIVGDEIADKPVHELKMGKDHHLHRPFVKVKDEEQNLAGAAGSGARAESRAKARERARERAKEKTITPVAGLTSNTSVETASTSPAASSTPAQPFTPPNIHLFPEFYVLSSQFRQQFDELHRPADLSSMLVHSSAPPPAPHLIPFTSSFYPTNSAASSFIVPGDGGPLQYSVHTAYNSNNNNNDDNNNNTPNSPRGTLQSIFSSPASSSMQGHVQPLPPLMMMMGQTQAYGATTLSSIVRESGHDHHETTFRQGSAELGRVPDSHHHSRIPMRIRGMELAVSQAEETRITPSSMQADYQ
ncbi:hypothetical protein GOP47_0002265 [Adiantum capillus-veneris]|uniref:Uncharacterized protein n=1 Tax=Adiantum capillus-veneris TaxID=13818 RepID=A0A9D4ZR32_ADICA|nr:hypothetical protein GOP47_0002265 [Adiantum capillus-veneris]